MWKVFLTGATGFLGGELAVALSQADSVDSVTCLIRAKNESEATERLRRVFALHRDAFDSDMVRAVAGDLSDDRLTDKLCRNRSLSNVNLVIHAGANTSFLRQKYPVLEETNVRGTHRMACWASNLSSLEKFVHIGTATIVGAGEDVVHRTVYEDEAPNFSARHLVGYTRSKMLAEVIARSTIPEDKLTVLRPSILVGDTRGVVPRSFDIAWIIVALRELRMFFGNPDAICDIIPVDYAANAILGLVTGRQTYSTYHISAGASATTCRKIIEALDYDEAGKPPLVFCSRSDLESMKRWLRSNGDPEPELAKYADHIAYIRRGIGKKHARILLSGMEAYWRFIDLSQRFDNSRLLEDTGIGLPEPAPEYLKRTAVYLQDIDPIEAAFNP
jgi:thioester reductase-like protein